MIIKNAQFVKSYSLGYNGSTNNEICVVGRSNVGKSTFINALCNNYKLAKTSSTPGRTRLINVFSINGGQFNLVDLPGYGYALASKAEKESWDAIMGHYFENTATLKQALVLVDIRHEPTDKDVAMLNYLYYYAMPFTVIATKCDKLSKSQIYPAVAVVARKLGIGKDDVIPVSSQTKLGFEKVLCKIEQALNEN